MGEARVTRLDSKLRAEIVVKMRIALSFAAGVLLAGLGVGAVSAAPAAPPAGVIAGGATVEQARVVRKRGVRRSSRRVMGLPAPGTRKGRRGRPGRI